MVTSALVFGIMDGPGSMTYMTKEMQLLIRTVIYYVGGSSYIKQWSEVFALIVKYSSRW